MKKENTEIHLRSGGWCCKFPLRNAIGDPEHFHDFWQIDLCEKGEARLKTGDSSFHLRAGDLVIISPGLKHRFIYSVNQEFRCWSFKFDSTASVSPQIVPVCDDETRKERLVIVDIVSKMCHGFFPENILKQHIDFVISEVFSFAPILESLLSGIVKKWFWERSEEPVREKLTDMINEYVYQRGGEAVSVQEVAEKLGYSAGHLRILVQQSTGRSTKYLIDQARIKIAKDLLLYSDMRVNEVSALMGFADVKYFSRFFRKYTGVVPRDYIRSKRML